MSNGADEEEDPTTSNMVLSAICLIKIDSIRLIMLFSDVRMNSKEHSIHQHVAVGELHKITNVPYAEA